MFKAQEAATTFRSGAVSVLAPAASPPRPLRRDARRRLRSGTEHEPPPPLPSGLMGSLPCAGVHVIHRLNISVTCALFQNTYMLRFWNFAAPAALRRKNTGLQRQEHQPIRRRRADPPPHPAAGPSAHPSDLRSEQRIYQTAERRQIKGVVQASETQRTISDDGKLTSCQTHRSDCSKTSLLYQGPFTVARQQHRKTFYSGKALTFT